MFWVFRTMVLIYSELISKTQQIHVTFIVLFVTYFNSTPSPITNSGKYSIGSLDIHYFLQYFWADEGI